MALAARVSCRSLYSLAVGAVAATYSGYMALESRGLPNSVLLDIISSLHGNGRARCLLRELSSLTIFERLLRCKGTRNQLHHCFQQLGDEKNDVANALADSFSHYSLKLQEGGAVRALTAELRCAIELGLSLGAFLTDIGYLPHAGLVYKGCLTLLTGCRDEQPPHASLLSLDCYRSLLRTLTLDRSYLAAETILDAALQLVELLEQAGTTVNKADLYATAAELFFMKNIYDKAFAYSRQALQELDCSVPVKVVVGTLRLCAVTSVAKRDLSMAAVFARHAVKLARHTLGENHPCYADALLGYGYYLLNADFTEQAVAVYEEALKKRELAYGARSFMAASCYEDLAYALYLKEYASGDFTRACELIGTATGIYSSIFPKEHLVLATAKRVKALILEEMALDRDDDVDAAAQLLEQAWHLHTEALQLAIRAWGEENVQTAKHYGNIGRLYQSFGQFEKARELHLRAIDIKERALGPEDYEVAVSVGHLASLYNYDMELHDEAEQLYLRSVSLGLKLFGPTYSGLEYDYRGLVWLYTAKNDTAKADYYEALLDEWSDIRMRKQEVATDALHFLYNDDDDDSASSTSAAAGAPSAAAGAPSAAAGAPSAAAGAPSAAAGAPSAAAGAPSALCSTGAAMRGARHSCPLPLCSTVLPRLRKATGT